MFQTNRTCTYKSNAKIESYWSWLNRLSYGSGKEGLCRIPKAVGRKRGKTDVSRALEEHKASSTGEAHLRGARGLEVEKCSYRLWQDCWWLLWLVLLACTGVVVLEVCLEWLDEEQNVWKCSVEKKDSQPPGQAYMLRMGSPVDASSREERSERRWREFDWFSEAETREHVCDLVYNVWAK